MNRAAPVVLALAAFVAASLVYVMSDGAGRGASAADVFTCGEDAPARELAISREAVILAGDGRLYAPCAGGHDEAHRESRQRALLESAAANEDDEIARLAYVALGRAGVQPMDESGALKPYVQAGLTHPAPAVRQAAAAAMASALDGAVREPVSVEQLLALREGVEDRRARTGGTARLVAAALRAALDGERDAATVAVFVESLGRLPYDRPEDRTAVETLLVERLADGADRARLGAARGLEYLLRRSPGSAGTETIRVLRQVATSAAGGDAGSGDETASRIRRLAMLSLSAARDADPATVLAAATDPDWQVRRLAVLRMTIDARGVPEALNAAMSDPALQVRIDAVRLAGRAAARSSRCAGLLMALDDGEVPVVLAALDALPERCREQADILARLEQFTGMLGTARDHWHVPARALGALARLAPDRADAQLARAATHGIWQVRAAAADVARAVNREDVAVSLMGDDEPNVRAAALRALGQMLSDQRFPAAIEAVQSDDFDLIRTGAGMLEDPPDPTVAADVMLAKLRALTDEAWDTSRDPRMAIVRQLATVLPASRADELLPYTADFDSRIALAARDAYLALSGSATLPAGAPAQLARYPLQPSAEALMSLPRAATLELDGGVMVELELLADEAPVLVARFSALAEAGHYDGLSIHRIAPNFVIQGGSPGANEYSGVDRYLRDELGAPNWRGTVGLSTRGRDTGDAQFYVNLVDNARLDHEYTVFARVTAGMDAVDRITDGARIVSIRTSAASAARRP